MRGPNQVLKAFNAAASDSKSLPNLMRSTAGKVKRKKKSHWELETEVNMSPCGFICLVVR